MHQPDQRGGGGGAVCRDAKSVGHPGTGQRRADDGEEQERTGDVNRDVDGVIRRLREAADGVVECERQVDEGTARHRGFPGRRERFRQRPEVLDGSIRDDCGLVVPDKRHVEAVPVGDDANHDDQQRQERARPRVGAGGGGGRRAGRPAAPGRASWAHRGHLSVVWLNLWSFRRVTKAEVRTEASSEGQRLRYFVSIVQNRGRRERHDCTLIER